MAILNPCCCITLRTGAKLVAIVDLILALILLIIFISDLTLNISETGKVKEHAIALKRASPTISTTTTTIITPITNSPGADVGTGDEEESDCEDYYDSTNLTLNPEPFTSVTNANFSPYVTSGIWTILTVFLATNVGISALLYTGSRNYSIRRCKWWFYIQSVITAVALIVLILLLCFQVSFILVILDFFHLIYRFYTLWVVYLFIGELTYLDTLCSLNKKGGSGIMYPAPMYTTTVPISHHEISYNNGGYPYSQNNSAAYQTHPHLHYLDSGNGIGAMESPMHYNSSDDGLPPNGLVGGGGGIDNPTYLP